VERQAEAGCIVIYLQCQSCACPAHLSSGYYVDALHSIQFPLASVQRPVSMWQTKAAAAAVATAGCRKQIQVDNQVLER